MADAKFEVATSWEQALSLHRKWMQDYNYQRHWAHEKREDGCHSPAEVIGWHKGTMYPESVLDRILFATRFTRSLDKHGFLRFLNWKLYAALGYVRCHEPQGSGYSMHKQYRQSSLVPDSDGVGTSAVVKSAKADFSGCHPVKNGARSVSIGPLGTRLSR